MDKFARCPKCHYKVRLKTTRWGFKRIEVAKPGHYFYGDHYPGGNSYRPNHCEMSSKPVEEDAATQP